ncbi:unnamed protein product [Echinostoma caproni]|uniref:Uncharacterized protein n=1 Tax=Echinostoma caproni TaxID=27848 RepID=A0A183B2J4_9TREM|nr:unnamed protein product [Echinostoma caproni]
MSGTKCVTVTSGSTLETLCPSGTINQFTSKQPIEISAESGATTEASTTGTTTPTTKPGGDSAGPKPDQSGEAKKDGGNSEPEKKKKTDSEGSSPNPEANEERPENRKGNMVKQPPASPEQAAPGPNAEEGKVPVPSKLIRRSRDTSNTDVIVYYVLGKCFIKAIIL